MLSLKTCLLVTSDSIAPTKFIYYKKSDRTFFCYEMQKGWFFFFLLVKSRQENKPTHKNVQCETQHAGQNKRVETWVSQQPYILTKHHHNPLIGPPHQSVITLTTVPRPPSPAPGVSDLIGGAGWIPFSASASARHSGCCWLSWAAGSWLQMPRVRFSRLCILA